MRAAAALVAVLTLALPAPAHASGEAVLRDCMPDGQLDRTYSRADLREARRILPSDQDEYSACRDVIDEALLDARQSIPDPGGGGGSGMSGGSDGGGGTSTPAPAAPTPTEPAPGSGAPAPDAVPAPEPTTETPPAPAVKAARTPEDRLAALEAVGTRPAALGDPVMRDLPWPLLVTLLAVAALAAAAAAPALRRSLPRVRVALRRG